MLKKGGEGREFLFLFPFPPPPASSAKLDFRRGWLIEPLFFCALNISYVQSPYLISKQREIGASTNLSGHAPVPSHFPCESSWTTIRAKTSGRVSFQNDCPCTILNWYYCYPVQGVACEWNSGQATLMTWESAPPLSSPCLGHVSSFRSACSQATQGAF